MNELQFRQVTLRNHILPTCICWECMYQHTCSGQIIFCDINIVCEKNQNVSFPLILFVNVSQWKSKVPVIIACSSALQCNLSCHANLLVKESVVEKRIFRFSVFNRTAIQGRIHALVKGAPKFFLSVFADGAQLSCTNEVRPNWLGSRTCSQALEAFRLFIGKYAFCAILGYLFILFLK